MANLLNYVKIEKDGVFSREIRSFINENEINKKYGEKYLELPNEDDKNFLYGNPITSLKELKRIADTLNFVMIPIELVSDSIYDIKCKYDKKVLTTSERHFRNNCIDRSNVYVLCPIQYIDVEKMITKDCDKAIYFPKSLFNLEMSLLLQLPVLKCLNDRIGNLEEDMERCKGRISSLEHDVKYLKEAIKGLNYNLKYVAEKLYPLLCMHEIKHGKPLLGDDAWKFKESLELSGSDDICYGEKDFIPLEMKRPKGPKHLPCEDGDPLIFSVSPTNSYISWMDYLKDNSENINFMFDETACEIGFAWGELNTPLLRIQNEYKDDMKYFVNLIGDSLNYF